MTSEELKQEKAKRLRYKKPLAQNMNIDFIREGIWAMGEMIGDCQYFVDDEDNLVNAMCGDEDEAYAFKMAFSDLAADVSRLEEDLEQRTSDWEKLSDYFDLLFPATRARTFGGYLGWDSYENDYFGLEPYEYDSAEDEAEKSLCRLTKKDLLFVVGQCLRIYSEYVGVQYRYDCLEASLNIIREKNLGNLKLVKAIEEQYEKAEKSSRRFAFRYDEEVKELDKMLEQVPQEYWL